jgi:hypothetical protein
VWIAPKSFASAAIAWQILGSEGMKNFLARDGYRANTFPIDPLLALFGKDPMECTPKENTLTGSSTVKISLI